MQKCGAEKFNGFVLVIWSFFEALVIFWQPVDRDLQFQCEIFLYMQLTKYFSTTPPRFWLYFKAGLIVANILGVVGRIFTYVSNSVIMKYWLLATKFASCLKRKSSFQVNLCCIEKLFLKSSKWFIQFTFQKFYKWILKIGRKQLIVYGKLVGP